MTAVTSLRAEMESIAEDNVQNVSFVDKHAIKYLFRICESLLWPIHTARERDQNWDKYKEQDQHKRKKMGLVSLSCLGPV